ncbi:MAG: thiamine diphosphokinase [Pseudomonadota bacterium]
MVPIPFAGPLVLVGGGSLSAASLATARAALGALPAWGAAAPVLVAADGAADRLAALGEAPALVLGDLDSVADPEGWRARGVRVERLAEQDTTDFEKCLYATEAPLYLGVGFIGRRLDHSLAVLNALVTRAGGHGAAKRVVLLTEHEVIFAARPGRRYAFALAAGETVSVFPLAPVGALASTGLVWPLHALTLAPAGVQGGVIGTSNRATGETVTLGFDRAGALLLLPRAALGEALAQVASEA